MIKLVWTNPNEPQPICATYADGGRDCYAPTLSPFDTVQFLDLASDFSSFEFGRDDAGNVVIAGTTACDFAQWLASHGIHPETPATIYLPDDRPHVATR